MLYGSNLTWLEMYMVDDPDETVWWDLHGVAQEEVRLGKEKLCIFVGREEGVEDVKKT